MLYVQNPHGVPMTLSEPVPPRLQAQIDKRDLQVVHPEFAVDTRGVPESPRSAVEQDTNTPGGVLVSAPRGNASQETWREYAISQGFDPAEVVKLSRNELRSLFDMDEEVTDGDGVAVSERE